MGGAAAIRAAINEVAFLYRSRLAQARKTPRSFREPSLDLEILPSFARAMLASDRADELVEKYRLEPVTKTALHLGTLFLIDLFDRLFAAKPEYFSQLPSTARVLDVGARDFESAPAIYFAIKQLGVEPQLTGIELDAFRRIAGGTCADAGCARAVMLREWSSGQHRYLAEDVLAHGEHYDAIVWLHPFLDEERLLEWGLPRRFLRPRAMLEHVISLLSPRGVLMIVNQERSESAAQQSLFDEVGKVYESVELPLHFRARDEPAYVHLFAST